MVENEGAHFFKTLVLVVAVTLIPAAGIVIWYQFGRDTWERDNRIRIGQELDEAAKLSESERLQAYEIYSRIVREASGRKLSDTLERRLEDADREAKRLAPLVQADLQKREDEKRRRAERERLEAEERERARLAAVEHDRQRMEEEAKRTAQKREAEARRRAEKDRIASVVRRYGDASQSPRDALNALKRLEARTEVGINYQQYMEALGQAWADVKVFVESPDGKALPEFSDLLTRAADFYRYALQIWQAKIGSSSGILDRTRDRYMQDCWARASERLGQAEALLDPARTESVLAEIGGNAEEDQELIARFESYIKR